MCVKWSIRGSKDYELFPSFGCFAASINSLLSFIHLHALYLDDVRLTCCDESLLVLVINTESLLQLLLERLVILLHQELGGQLTKLTKLEKSGP